jgi:hypothetical protein
MGDQPRIPLQLFQVILISEVYLTLGADGAVKSNNAYSEHGETGRDSWGNAETGVRRYTFV